MFDVDVAEVDQALLEAEPGPESDTELPITAGVDWLDAETDEGCLVLLSLVPSGTDVEDDEAIEARRGRDADGAVIFTEADALAPALCWQLTGTETGVASTAGIDVMVLMVRARPGKAG